MSQGAERQGNDVDQVGESDFVILVALHTELLNENLSYFVDASGTQGDKRKLFHANA